MNIRLFIKQALGAIRANKMRSTLSLLGIVIGIMSFVVMLALGEGARASILEGLSVNNDIITLSKGGGRMRDYEKDASIDETSTIVQKPKNIFTLDVIMDVPNKVPGVDESRPRWQETFGDAKYEDKVSDSSIVAVMTGSLQHMGAKLAYGSMFDEQDVASGSQIAILGYRVVKNIFGDQNPLGKQIAVDHNIFIIGGVLQEKDRNIDEGVFIPYTTFETLYPKLGIYGADIVVHDEKDIDTIKDYLNFYLFKMSGVDSYSNIEYSLRTNKESIKELNEASKKFSLLLGGIGAIALMVGGIGIMNIMLVSVTERTKEIGIKKAIGATNSIILFQFLIESSILTILGSLIAIAGSYGVVALIGRLIPEFEPVISLRIMLIAISVATVMGIVFGLMPAYKAAKLKVIDALHFE